MLLRFDFEKSMSIYSTGSHELRIPVLCMYEGISFLLLRSQFSKFIMPQKTGNNQELFDQPLKLLKPDQLLAKLIQLGFWQEGKIVPENELSNIEEQAQWQAIKAALESIPNWEEKLKQIRLIQQSSATQNRELKQLKLEAQLKDNDWRERASNNIVYLGEGLSKGLEDQNSNIQKLTQFGLPLINNASMLASAMNISISELRFLSYQKKRSKINHYQRFYTPKKNGGHRLISAPMPRLKQAQYWILNHILEKVPIHQAAKGFVKQKSIINNAYPHIQKDIVINFDIQDFFPTISYNRIKGLFKNLGYSEQLATILSLICTESPMERIKIDGEIFYLATGERVLPQGAPSSPALTNILCYKLDKRLQGLAEALSFTYTRYADDLSFSASGEAAQNNVQNILWTVNMILKEEGFTLHPDKLRIMRKHQKQEVTGIIVNQHLSVDNKTLKKFRALLFQIGKDGLEGKHWNGKKGPRLIPSIYGFAQFVNMVNPRKGEALLKKVRDILSPYSNRLNTPPKDQSSSNDEKDDEWWNMWES